MAYNKGDKIGIYTVQRNIDQEHAGKSTPLILKHKNRLYFGKVLLAPKRNPFRRGKKKSEKDVLCDIFYENRVALNRDLVRCHALSGDGLVKLHDFFEHDCCFVSVYERQTDARITKPQNRRRFTLSEKIQVMTDVARGLKSMHSVDLVHSDVRLNNILFFKGKTGTMRGKLCDVDDCYYTGKPWAQGEEGSVVHDPSYAPPELIKYSNADFKGTTSNLTPACDVFSFGVTLCEIMSLGRPSERANPNSHVTPGQVLLANKALDWDRETFAKLSSRYPGLIRENLVADTVKQIEALITECLRPNPLRRPTMANVLKRLAPLRPAGIERRSRIGSVPEKSIPPLRGLRRRSNS